MESFEIDVQLLQLLQVYVHLADIMVKVKCNCLLVRVVAGTQEVGLSFEARIVGFWCGLLQFVPSLPSNF